MFVLPSATVLSRTAFNAVGGFGERLSGYEDDDLFLRIFRAGFANVFIDRGVTRWRIHTGSAWYSARMGVSRMIYFRKLLAEFPDDPPR
jgi:GT2 family glycosyltransferase